MTEQIITSSILILAICLIRVLFARRISPTVLYALWLLAAIKLLVPMTGLENRFNVMNLIERQEQARTVTAAQPSGETGAAGANAENMEGAIATDQAETQMAMDNADGSQGSNGNRNAESDVYTGAVGSDESQRMILPQLAAWIAAIGTGMLALIFGFNNLLFYGKLRKKRIKVTEYQGLTVYEVPGQGSPYLYGLIRPAVYLSRELTLPEERREYILLHEYTHYRHRDYLWACVRSICVILYWYHPLVWLAAVLSARDGELACDEGVVRTLNDERRMEYGETLLETLQQIRNGGLVQNPLALSTGMTGGAREMKTRMKRIAQQPHAGIVTAVLVAAMSIGLVGCTYGGADSAEDAAAGSTQEKLSAEETLQLYASVLDNRSEDTAFALLEMDTVYRVLVVSDLIYDEGTESQASPCGTVYYYVDGECRELGEVMGAGTAYPLTFSNSGIYAAEGSRLTKYVIDKETGTLKEQKIWTSTYSESGEDTYTVETDGNTETLTEEEWYASYEAETRTSRIIHFAYEDEDCLNQINDNSVGLNESAYLRENPGQVGDYAVVGEDEVTLTLDFDNDGVAEQVSMKKGNAKGKSENGEWDYYRLECNGSALGVTGNDVSAGLWAFSPDGKVIWIGVVEYAWYTEPSTELFSYASEDGDGNIRYLGTISQDIRSGEGIASGLTVENGVLYIWDEWNHLYQDYVWKGYEIGEDGEMEVVYQDYYELMGYSYLDSDSLGPRLLVDVTLYDRPEGEVIGAAAAWQEILFHDVTGWNVGGVAENSDSMWYCLYGADGELGWIESHWDSEISGVVWGGTGLPEQEVFTGYVTWAG